MFASLEHHRITGIEHAFDVLNDNRTHRQPVKRRQPPIPDEHRSSVNPPAEPPAETGTDTSRACSWRTDLRGPDPRGVPGASAPTAVGVRRRDGYPRGTEAIAHRCGPNMPGAPDGRPSRVALPERPAAPSSASPTDTAATRTSGGTSRFAPGCGTPVPEPGVHRVRPRRLFRTHRTACAPDTQGLGLGRSLLYRLLRDRTERTVLLSTPEVPGEDNRAWRLYRRFGFRGRRTTIRLHRRRRPFAVLGRTLPLEPHLAPPASTGPS